ncbi:Na+/H+ antiporter subunit G [Psychromarinibacter halotolerans]|uniref:Na+/H+ antiporter subunit G n=1 Tax=Psychromarinibacter halotolerans TaxID=1775175 RepID=A0ABV7GYB6_9RHOB|nr:Na+/H+ antiporter subunit G [Psychromarinibacter halotolerans]MAQ83067.1 Na+/H+ antiporter subunit G [Maritimibacter sp.]MDF0597959.1 Na+/H+ antiporter subunit G [Psychromarinibacter halotolerans]
MHIALEIAVCVFLVISGVFGLVGSFGLIKLHDTMQRLHAPTKATTLGVGGVLIASMIYHWASTGQVTFHELLITLFLFLTAPVSANFIAKTYLAPNVDEDALPDAQTEHGWAIYNDPPLIAEALDSENEKGA